MEDDFFEKVYQVVRQIPYGRVTSYGAIAKFIGASRSARIVGYAMNASIVIPGIAAHRVLNRNGLLTGKHHFGGSTVMKDLLESEGIKVINHQVKDWDKLFWDPARHLNRKNFI